MNYESFKQRLINEGYIEANPVRFIRPDIEDVKVYFSDKGSDGVRAQDFYNHWESLNWYRGKTRVKNWKLTANTWIKNNEKNTRPNGNNTGAKRHSLSERVRENARQAEAKLYT